MSWEVQEGQFLVATHLVQSVKKPAKDYKADRGGTELYEGSNDGAEH